MKDDTTPAVVKRDAAEIPGDNISIEADYSHIIALEEDPLALIGMKPGTHYAWVTNGKDGTKDQIPLRTMQGYIVCTDRDVKAPAQDPKVRERLGGKIEVSELTLMQCPEALYQARQKVFTDRDAARRGSIKRDLEKEYGRDNVFGDVSIKRGG